MIKRTVALITVIIMLVSLTACSSGGSDKQIYFPIDEDPEYLDPQIISSDGAKNIIANCFEGLVTIDAEGEIIPGCAESWKITDNGLTYTFSLRRDCQWRVSDASGALLGENYKEAFDARVTADDFVFAFKRALRPETRSPGAKNLYCIKNAVAVHNGNVSEEKLGVTAKDDYTLVISLEWADPDFLYSLLDAVCMPCNEEFFEATGGRYGLSTKYLLYNGPFYISNWADDIAITVKRNDKYYGKDSVIPASVYFSMNNEQATRKQKIIDDIYHVAPLTEAQAQELSGMSKYGVRSYSSTVLSLVFNCKDGVFSNADMRRAAAASFDFDAVYAKHGMEKAQGIIPESLIVSGDSYRNSVGSLKHYSNGNPDALLTKGLEAIGRKSVDITLLCTAEYEDMAREIMQTWQSELGVRFNVNVEVLELSVLREKAAGGSYQMALYPLSYSSITAFNGLARFTTDNANNVCNFSSRIYDEKVAVIKTVSDKKATVDATLEAEKYLISACPLIPISEQKDYYGFGKGVSGVISNPTGEIFYFRSMLAK